ncbi:response regulator transcription factor [soil metagenome]
MTLTLQPITGSVKIVAVGDASALARGRPAEFRHRGLTLATRPTAMAALLEVGRDPHSIVLVPTDLSDFPLTEFIDVLRSVAHVPVIAGIAPGCTPHSVSELFEHGVASTVALPATPGRLAEAVLASRVSEPSVGLVLEVGQLALDDSRHTVTWHGREVAIPSMRFDILRYLLRAYPRVVPARELVEFIGDSAVDRLNGVRVAIGRLRAAFLEAVPHSGAPIETVHHVGYRLRP